MFVCLTQWVTCVCVMETNILTDGTILLLACIVGVIREGSDPLLGGGMNGKLVIAIHGRIWYNIFFLLYVHNLESTRNILRTRIERK